MKRKIKFTEASVKRCLAVQLKDKEWREVYENAPAGAQKRLRIAFWFSANQKKADENTLDECRTARAVAEREMTEADARYLAEHFLGEVGRRHYEELRLEKRYDALRTVKQLDRSIAWLMECWPETDRALVQRSSEAFKTCTDPSVEYRWLWEAVGGNGARALLVGDVFQHGHGVEVDAELALFWIERAARCGSDEACTRLACIYENPKDAAHDMHKALFWLLEGVRRGSVDARRSLGIRMAREDARWQLFRLPNLAGTLLFDSNPMQDESGYTQYYISICYEKGLGVKKCPEFAKAFYEAARRRRCPLAK